MYSYSHEDVAHRFSNCEIESFSQKMSLSLGGPYYTPLLYIVIGHSFSSIFKILFDMTAGRECYKNP